MIKNYFHVGYSGGAGGKFISVIMHYALNEPTNRPIFFKHTGKKDYTAHIENEKIFKSIKSIKHNLNYQSAIDEFYPWRSFFEKHKDTVPWEYVVYPAGRVPDVTSYNDLQATYPDWRELSITIKPKSWKQVLLNHLYKVNHASPTLEEILADAVPMCDYNLEHDMWHSHKSQLPEDYQNKIYSIEYSQICDEPEVVLNIISEVVERPIGQPIRDAYMEYVENQLAFRKQYPC